MSVKRLQNRIAESRFTLPATGTITLLTWIGAYLTGQINIITLPYLFIIISTYLMVELNNSNALMRIYSRMVSCSFLVLCLIASPEFMTMKSSIVLLSLVATYLIGFHAYQEKRSHGLIFFAYLCLGIGSMVFAKLLYLVPLLWIVLSTNLMAFSMKSFVASILGLVTPYWFAATYYIYIGDFTTFTEHVTDLADFTGLFDISGITANQVVTFGFVLIVAMTGIIHFLRTSYNDKIRTRMIYDIFITIDIASVILLFLFPRHFNEWLAIIIVNTSPLIAHYITLTRTWMTNISFYIFVVGAALLTCFNIWMPSFQF